MGGGKLSEGAGSGNEVHPRAVLHRVGDEADFKQFEVEQLAARRTLAAGARAVAERQAAHGAAPAVSYTHLTLPTIYSV